MYTIDKFAMMEPMKYYNSEAESQKRTDMINNKDDQYVATVKKDGDWSMLIHYEKGHNLIRSRSISKVTGVYGDYTEKVPHICEMMDRLPDNTVLLCELCWDEPGTNANTVGTILRCLPAKAVERQKDHKLKALMFDCLMVAGEDLTGYGYFERYAKGCNILEYYTFPNPYIYPTQMVFIDEHHDNFLEWADEIIRNGGEGLVIQYKHNPYMPGTRTAWKTLKLKQSLPEMELKVVGTLEPNKYYDGLLPNAWKYWEVQDKILTSLPPQKGYTLYETDGGPNPNWELCGYDYRPVTKPYYYHWKNGITVEYNGLTTDIASGLTDADREWLATLEAQQMIENGELYAVVKAMSTNDLGKLRHGYLVRLRNDM